MIRNPIWLLKNLFSPKDRKSTHPASERVMWIDGFPTIGTAGGEISLTNQAARTQAYITVSELFAIVNRISADCSSIELEIFKHGDSEAITLDNQQGADRQVIKALELMRAGDPNFLPFTWTELRKNMHTSRLLDGNGYLWIPKDPAFGVALDVKYIPPLYVTPETDPPGQQVITNPVRYRYGSGQNLTGTAPGQYFDDGSIYHMIDTLDPQRPWQGISPLRALTRDVNLLVAAKEFNRKTLATGGRIPGAFIAKGEITDENRKSINAQYHKSRENNDPLLMQGLENFLPYGYTAKDLEWLSALRFSLRAVANGYNYPARLLQEQLKGGLIDTELESVLDYYWTTNPIPAVRREAELLTLFFFGSTSPYFFKPKESAILAVQRGNMRRLKELSAVTGFISVNEKRDAAGKEPLTDSAGGDVILVTENTSLADMAFAAMSEGGPE